MDKDINKEPLLCKGNKPLSIIRNDDKLVIIRNMCRTSFDVANNPWLSLDIDYITVTKGADHILTVVNKDGLTWSFEWGKREATCISLSTKALKDNVLRFLSENGVYVGLTAKAVDVRQWNIGNCYCVRVDGEDGSYDVSYFEKEEEANKYAASVKVGEDMQRPDEEMATRMYVVIVDEHDDDSNTNERLISCATFSTYDKAKTYMAKKTILCMHGRNNDDGRYTDESMGVDDTVSVYDEDGTLLLKLSIIETVVDEFDGKF